MEVQVRTEPRHGEGMTYLPESQALIGFRLSIDSASQHEEIIDAV